MYKISVVLVNYFGAIDTIECVRSLKNTNLDLQIIIIDNSNDKSEFEMIRGNCSDITLIACKDNYGFAKANNIGINYAIGQGTEYVLILNNDTIVDTNMISELLINCNSNEILVPKMLFYDDPTRIWYGGGEINKMTGNIYVQHYNENDNFCDFSRYCTFATGCCMLIPVSVIREMGYVFNENYFMYCEDTEFCIRAIKNNVKIKYIPTAKLWHKVSSSSGGINSKLSIYYTSRNRFYYVEEHKDFFWWTAKWCAFLSRIIRIGQYWIVRSDLWKSYYKAIVDYCNKKYGKQSID